MSWLSKFLASIFALSLLAACGFSPMYGISQQEAHGELSKIIIPAMRGSEAAYLRAEIEKAFNPSGQRNVTPEYTLQLTLSKGKEPLVIRPDGTISRYNIALVADYSLERLRDGSVMTRGTLHRTVSFNMVDSDFSSFVSERDVTERGLSELAESFRLTLNSWFANNSTVAASQ